METGGRKPAPPKKTNAPPTKTSKKAKIAPAKAVPAKTAPAKTKGSSKPQGSQPGDSLPSRSVTSGSKRSREEDTSSLNSELLRQLVEANGIIKDLQASIKEKERNDPHVEILPDVPANRTTNAHGPSKKDRTQKHRNPNPSKDEWAAAGLEVDLSKVPDQALVDLHDRLASPRALKKLRVERPELYQTIEAALGIKDLGMRSHQTYRKCGQALSEFHANPQTYQMPADFLDKLMALNSPSTAQHKVQMKVSALVQECADGEGKPDEIVWNTLGLCAFDTPRNLIKSMQDTIWTLSVLYTSAQAVGNFKTCFYAFWAYKAARDLYEVQWSALTKALGQEKAHELLIERMKTFGEISNDQWDKLVSLARGGKFEDACIALAPQIKRSLDYQKERAEAKDGRPVRCSHCGIEGHSAEQCYKGKNKRQRKSPKGDDKNFNEHGVKATCDVYVDDYPIRADTHVDMQRAFEIMDKEAELLGLEFNPSKDEALAEWHRSKGLDLHTLNSSVVGQLSQAIRVFQGPEGVSSGKQGIWRHVRGPPHHRLGPRLP
eukprot:gene9191-biopygen9068